MANWLLLSFAARDAGDVGVAIETPSGPVVESLLEHGFAVHSLNPKQLDRFRDRSLDISIWTDSDDPDSSKKGVWAMLRDTWYREVVIRACDVDLDATAIRISTLNMTAVGSAVRSLPGVPGRLLRGSVCGVALVILSAVCATGARAATIDAEQFCRRTPTVRDAILDEVPGASATCTETRSETTLTDKQLSRIHGLDFTHHINSYRFFREFRTGDFNGLDGLRELIIVHASLRIDGLAHVGVPCATLRGLRRLFYANSIVSHITSPRFFDCLDNLEELNLQRNNIRYEPGVEDLRVGVFCPLRNLRKLSIGSNRMRTLPRGVFACLSRLEELDMYDMWYEYAHIGFGSDPIGPGVFEGLSRLKSLHLGHNALGAAPIDPGIFDPLVRLEYLNVRDNPLMRVLPESADRLPAGVRIVTDPGVRRASEVTNVTNEPATGQPRIIGTVLRGQTLSVDLSDIADGNGLPSTFTYQWRGE